MPNDGARHLDVASPAAPAGAVQDGDLVSHLGAHDGARQWEAGIVVGGEGRLGQESAGAGRRAGSGELAQVAEALIEAGHGGFLLVESESSGRQEGVEELEGLQQVGFMGAADDDVIGEAGVAVARVAHGPVDVGQGQVGQERGQAGALGDAAVAGTPLAPGAPRPGNEPDEVDGARAAGDGGEGGQGVLDAEVGEIVLDVGAQHVAVAGVPQPGEVVDGVIGADTRPVGEGAWGHGEVGPVGDRVDDRALDDPVPDGGDVQGADLPGGALGDAEAQERVGLVGS